MLTLLIIINLTIMAAIFGYAFACTAIVHPAMMVARRETSVEFFKPFFHKSQHLQLGLSMAVVVISLIISFISSNWVWFIGGLVLQLSGPYTIKILMPVNNRIMADGADVNSAAMISDLGSWGKLHLPRTLMAGAIFILFAFLAVNG